MPTPLATDSLKGYFDRANSRQAHVAEPRLWAITELEQPGGVAVEDLSLVVGAEPELLHPADAGHVLDKRVIDREEDPIDAHLHHGAGERRGREVAAGGEPEVAAEELAK